MIINNIYIYIYTRGDLGEDAGGAHPPPPEITCGFLIQPVFCQKKTMRFIAVEVELETSAPPPKKILDPPLYTTKNNWARSVLRGYAVLSDFL